MKTKLILAGLVAAAVVLTACRKGDEDPFFTLKSRKSRLFGEWDMTACQREMNHYNETGTYSSYLFSANEKAGNETYVGEHIIDTRDHIYHSYRLTIRRDGTWLKEKVYDFDHYFEDMSYKRQTSGSATETESGTWSFVERSGEYKNKERVLLTILATTWESGEITDMWNFTDPGITDYIDTYTPDPLWNYYEKGENLRVYDLLRLASDEMKWVAVTGEEQDGFGVVTNESITWEK